MIARAGSVRSVGQILQDIFREANCEDLLHDTRNGRDMQGPPTHRSPVDQGRGAEGQPCRIQASLDFGAPVGAFSSAGMTR